MDRYIHKSGGKQGLSRTISRWMGRVESRSLPQVRRKSALNQSTSLAHHVPLHPLLLLCTDLLTQPVDSLMDFILLACAICASTSVSSAFVSVVPLLLAGHRAEGGGGGLAGTVSSATSKSHTCWRSFLEEKTCLGTHFANAFNSGLSR